MSDSKHLDKRKKAVSAGRKRDDTLDSTILDAAIDILAEVGFDRMTMDMVAARAKAGKATVYRRWASKQEMVRDAIIWMSHASVDLETLPDTGSLKQDLLDVVKPYSAERGERKLRVLAGLGSFMTDHRKLSEEATGGVFKPWSEVNKKLMKRAQDRGEISKDADIDMACLIIIAMTAYHALTLNKNFDKKTYSDLIDGILLPALK